MKKQSEVKNVLVDDDYYPRLMKSGLGERKGATKIPRSNRPIRGGYYTLCRGLCPKNPMSDCAYRVVDSHSLDGVYFAPYMAVVCLKHGEAAGVTELKLDYDSRMTVLGVVGEYRKRSPGHYSVSLQYSSDDYEGYSQLSVSIPDDVARAFVAFKDTVEDTNGKEIHFEYYGKIHGIIAPIPSHVVLVNKNTDTFNAEELKNLIMHYPKTWLDKVVCLKEVSHKSAKRFCDRLGMTQKAHKKWRIVGDTSRFLGHYRVRKINSVAWKRFLLNISYSSEAAQFEWIQVEEI